MGRDSDERTPPWHAYDGCHGCRRGNAIGGKAVRQATPGGTACSAYTARCWSPGSDQPEDDRCVNCGATHVPHLDHDEEG